MTTETAMGAAMRRAGVNPNEAIFRVDLARFLNNGGTVERALEIVRGVADEMPAEGHHLAANSGQHASADARQPDGDDASRCQDAAKGQKMVAGASPPVGDGMGHRTGALIGRADVARLSPSEAGRILRSIQIQRIPTAEERQRNLKLAADSASKILMMIDGRDIRDFTIGELITAGRKKGFEHRVMTELGRRYGHLSHTMVLRVVAGDKAILEVIREAKESACAA